MPERKVTVGSSVGLHARPATIFTQAAAKLPVKVTIAKPGGKPVDARTDLYALGLILYEMLTGGPPFTDPEALDIIRHQIYTPVPKMDTVAPSVPIPAALEAVVMRLTEKRWTSSFSLCKTPSRVQITLT